MVKTILDATLGIIDLGQSLDAHANENVRVFVSQFDDFLGIVTVGTQFKKT